MAEQQETTRLEWERTGPFVPFEITRSRAQHVPEEYLKNAHWGVVDGDESYHVRSLVEGDEHWYPVEFILDRACWVEIRWHENLEQGGHWEAFRIAGPVLRYCRNVRPTWVKFNSKDTKESEWCSRF